MTHPFNYLRPALQDIGAAYQAREVALLGPENTDLEYWNWGSRLIRLTFNVSDNLGCDVSTRGDAATGPDDWKAIFHFTVPGIEEFTDEQKLDRLMSVPKGRRFPPFMAEHIRRLPAALGHSIKT